MRSPNNLLLALAVLLAASSVSARAADSGDEALGALFRLHANSPTGDAAVCTAAAQAVLDVVLDESRFRLDMVFPAQWA